jgi:hypothetical protein
MEITPYFGLLYEDSMPARLTLAVPRLFGPFFAPEKPIRKSRR